MSPLAVKTTEPVQIASHGEVKTTALKQLFPYAIVALSACFLLFGELGRFPLFNPDEALYAEPAREMLENGDWITTYLNYVVRFTKPPLVIWAQALSINLFGVNEFAVRFFEAASGVVLVASTYAFAEKFAGRRVAIAAGVALVTAPLFIGTAREAITDMPLSLFMASAMMCFFTAAKTGRTSFTWLAWIMVGLSVMTKGPVGLVLPVALIAAFAVLSGKLKQSLRDYKVIPGMAIVAAIALPWFITEIAITKGAYFHEFILRENFQRFTSAIDSHGQPWWYHFAAMFGGFVPWCFFLPGAIAATVPDLVSAIRAQSASLISFATGAKSPPETNQGSPPRLLVGVEPSLALFCLLWASGTLVFFSASVSKLLPYTMPAFPALAVLVGIEFERIIQTRSMKRALIPVALIAVTFGGATAVMPFALKKLRDAPPGLVDLIRSFTTYELVFSLSALAMVARKLYRTAWFVFCVPMLFGLLFFGGKIVSSLSEQWEGPLPAMARFASLSTQPIFVYDMRKPSVPFYTRRKIVQPSSPAELQAALEASGQAYVLTKKKTRGFIESIKGCKVVREEGAFLLAAYRRPSQ
ncbi:MAG: glycosyltransferase family 39 protein [Candidatus Obscuribacterales bacterium]|nr:glycosyltransferase family 39 protein [Candidatus Obscuribacterales bacterium]